LAHQTGAVAAPAAPRTAVVAAAATATPPAASPSPAPGLQPQAQTGAPATAQSPDLAMACQALVEKAPPEAEHPDVAGAKKSKAGVPVFVMMPLDTVRKDGRGLHRR